MEFAWRVAAKRETVNKSGKAKEHGSFIRTIVEAKCSALLIWKPRSHALSIDLKPRGFKYSNMEVLCPK